MTLTEPELHANGFTQDDIRDAIQAAGMVEDWATARAIADRAGWTCCLICARRGVFGGHLTHDMTLQWTACNQCFEVWHDKHFPVKVYTAGLFKRDVQ